jgi:hypothetical protein
MSSVIQPHLGLTKFRSFSEIKLLGRNIQYWTLVLADHSALFLLAELMHKLYLYPHCNCSISRRLYPLSPFLLSTTSFSSMLMLCFLYIKSYYLQGLGSFSGMYN